MTADEYFDELILSGAIEVAGIDTESGQFTYSFTPQAKEIAPELYNKSQEIFQDIVKDLWVKGFLSMDIQNQNPIVKMTDLIFNKLAISQLSIEEQTVLKSIMVAMKQQGDV